MATTTMLEQVIAARRSGVPILAIATPDPQATIKAIADYFADPKKRRPSAVIIWDAMQGAVGWKGQGPAAIEQLLMDPLNGEKEDPAILLQLHELLHRAGRAPSKDTKAGKAQLEDVRPKGRLPEQSIVIVCNAHRHVVVETPVVVQAVWNCRDPFKENFRTLILLCPYWQPPAELADDVYPISEPLPTADELRGIVNRIMDDAKRALPDFPVLDPPGVEKAVDALRGLSAFPAEQVTAMACSKTGMDIDKLWDRKRKMIEATPGLSVWRGGERFGDLGGVANVKQFMRKVLKGRGAPRVITFIDEIEKALAGSSGANADNTGVSQAMLGILLQEMQDKNASGMIFVGPPGSAKSAIAKAAGAEVEIPTVSFDIAGMKSALVGSSEEALRRALKVVSAISDDAALYIATCNNIRDLAPELRRRFNLGVFFFDLPDAQERKIIWDIYLKKFDLPAQEMPKDEGYTGAEIKQCAQVAWRLETSLAEASKYVTPVAITAKEQIQFLRKAASNRYISASYPGFYKYRALDAVDETEVETIPFEPSGGRRMEIN